MEINPIFFIGYFAGIAQVLALKIGYDCIRRMIQEHKDKATWNHIKAQNGF